MTDLTRTIAPKSDQLNADDLIGQTRTIRVTKVSLLGEPDQPVAINYEGDGGKPYKPCKSMRRVLVTVWGGDGSAYVGRRMRLYRDDKVKFGGDEVGGIRISHVSDIPRDVTMALTATRAQRRPYTVKVLPKEEGAQQQKQSEPKAPSVDAEAVFASAQAACREGRVSWGQWWKNAGPAEKDAIKPRVPELQKILEAGEVDDADPLAAGKSDTMEAPDAA